MSSFLEKVKETMGNVKDEVIEEIKETIDEIKETVEDGVKETIKEIKEIVQEGVKEVIHTVKRPIHKYNLKVSRIPHHQLKPKALPPNNGEPLPPVIDLRDKFPKPFNQDTLGSCTANALCGIVSYDLSSSFIGSRLFVYYNERMMENTIYEDAGAFLSDGINTLLEYGVCPETMWEYDINKYTIKPPDECYETAKNHKAISVSHILNDVSTMKRSLANGFPFVVGIQIYDGFESIQVALTGVVPQPNPAFESCLGGHAVVCCGYDDNKQMWIMRNSWGEQWGDKGYFYLPYLYLLDSGLSTDMWCIEKIN
jgi:C1A family cysteine protease